MKGLLVIALFIGVYSANPELCYGLSMEGGGTHGAYEAGVLYSLTHNLPANEAMWNYITGISTGSLNTGQAARFAYGDEKNMSEYLIQTWQMIDSQNSIAPAWPGSVFHSLFFKQSLYNTQPLHNLLTARIGNMLQRNVTVGATNVNTGKFQDFDESLSATDFVTAVMCSSAFPIAFPPVPFQGSYFGDGVVSLDLDAFSAISRCRKQGFDDDQIVMDLIHDFPVDDLSRFVSKSTREVMERINQVVKYYNQYWFNTQIFHAYPLVNFRYVIFPSQPLPPANSPVPLDFNPVDMQSAIDLGKTDALNAINAVKSGLKSPRPTQKSLETHYF